jgi:hypothetical protein
MLWAAIALLIPFFPLIILAIVVGLEADDES